ncbi:MAG: hypothetical protein HY355_01110 [Armatimonadetes bacterium]|nr:hypothetical protein [Armatimonadota bacterium]
MTRRLLLACLAVGLLAAAVVLGQRYRVESRNRAVEIALDAQDWVTLARREGRDVAAVMRELRRRGATSVALPDLTLKQLAEEGVVSYAAGGLLASQRRLGRLAEPFERLRAARLLRADAVYVTGAADRLPFVEGSLRTLLGDARVRALDGAIEVLGTPQDLEELGLGFHPSSAEPFRAAGLGIVLRPRNYRGLTAERLRALVEGYAQVAPSPTLIFALTEVQGYEGLIDEAAQEYRRAGARFGRIEVFLARRRQKGEDRLTALMRPDVIRVFSVTPEELLQLRAGEVADRFLRAAQERNIRILYVRPLLGTPAGLSAIDANLEMVKAIADGLRRLEFSPGRAHPLPEHIVPGPPMLAVALGAVVALGAAALGLVMLDGLAGALGVTLPGALAPVVLGAAVLGTAAAGLTRFDPLWRQLLALATAVAGASGAAVWAMPRPGASVRASVASGLATLRAGLLTLVRAVGIAVIAGIFVAALLSQWAFMLAISTFLGVKAAHAIPVALVGLWMAFVHRPPGGWRVAARELGTWVGQPLRIGAAVAALVIGAAVVVLLARTGNISQPALGIEQQLRATLEEIFVARPRTKEFLLGYPALAAAGAAVALGWRRAATALAMVGAIGTAGAINSFSHLHTPLVLTAWRTANALLLGAIVSIPTILVLRWTARLRPPS